MANVDFTSEHETPLQCTGKLVMTVYHPGSHMEQQGYPAIPVEIPCSRLKHRTDTRHCYVGALKNGATVEIYWRDTPGT
jgi:hypothetical protein